MNYWSNILVLLVNEKGILRSFQIFKFLRSRGSLQSFLPREKPSDFFLFQFRETLFSYFIYSIFKFAKMLSKMSVCRIRVQLTFNRKRHPEMTKSIREMIWRGRMCIGDDRSGSCCSQLNMIQDVS